MWKKVGIAVNDQYPKTIFASDNGFVIYRYFAVGDDEGVENFLRKLNEESIGE